MHSISELIALKQNAECFTEEQIQFFIDELLKGSLHDAQIGAFLMAVFLKGNMFRLLEFLTNDLFGLGSPCRLQVF